MRDVPKLWRLANSSEISSRATGCSFRPSRRIGIRLRHRRDIQYGDVVLVIGIGPIGLMSVAGATLRGASRIIAVGTRQVCIEAAKKYGADEFISYKNGPIDEQVLKMTNGKGVDKVIIAGGDGSTFAEAVKCLKPGGKIGNVNYLGSGEMIEIPRIEWGAEWDINRLMEG